MRLNNSFLYPKLTEHVNKAFNELVLMVSNHPEYGEIFRKCPVTINLERYIQNDYAGQADSNNLVIRLNAQLLTSLPKVKETLFHEYAHILADKLTNSHHQHGPVWVNIMKTLKQEPKVLFYW